MTPQNDLYVPHSQQQWLFNNQAAFHLDPTLCEFQHPEELRRSPPELTPGLSPSLSTPDTHVSPYGGFNMPANYSLSDVDQQMIDPIFESCHQGQVDLTTCCFRGFGTCYCMNCLAVSRDASPLGLGPHSATQALYQQTEGMQ